jgi:imidazoleglycerol-phosphate dehydratase
VECILEVVTTTQENGKLVEFTLPPYGKYPLNIGRSTIGTLQTKYVENFFTALAQTSGLHITLRKIRGDNGHHVVESAFKAFSRALRNLLDGVDAYDNGNYNDNGPSSNTAFERMWGLTSESYSSGLAMQRMGKVERSTKETSIMVCVRLFGCIDEKVGKDDDQKKEEKEEVVINTGIQTLNQFITILAREAQMSIEVQCSGDLYVDDHHTSEDVSIALGQALDEALGTRAGLNRMWCATGIYGDAEIEVTMDLSNRPDIHHNLSLSNTNEEYAGDLSVEKLIHTLETLATNSKSTVHIVEKSAGRSALETYYATAMAYGRALRMCSAVDPRRAGKTASSKGTLSV